MLSMEKKLLRNQIYFYLKLWDSKKFLNALKNYSSFYLSKLFNKYYVWGLPNTLFIEPTNLCNMGCTECPVGLGLLNRKQGLMDYGLFKSILDEIGNNVWYILLYFQGESTLHPQLINMINYAYEKKIFVEISTNGTRLADKNFCRQLVKSKLGKLVISLDGATEDTYRIYRKNGDFSRIISGISNILDERKKHKKSLPKVVIQFLVMGHNEHQINLVQDLGKRLEVDSVILKSPQIYDFENAESILPQNPIYRRYYNNNGSYYLKGSFSGYCKKLWIGSVITQDGRVVPCCFDKDAQYTFGKLKVDEFSKIWNNSEYHIFRKSVIKNRKNIGICKNCSEGLKTLFN
jgi:radical SAM protein with 4Fe4S-binding SPASM domain